MDNENYKEIAKIIKFAFGDSVFQSDVTDTIKEELVKGLADYFEKERIRINKLDQPMSELLILFDKEQFLKDCGVTE